MTVYDYRISSGATSVHGTGTITVNAQTTSVTGSGTTFTTQLHVGDVLLSYGAAFLVGAVKTIVDNTHLTLNVGALMAMSGATFDYDVMVNIETLVSGTMLPPKGDYQPWAVSVPTGDGLARGLGRPLAQWRWNVGGSDYLTGAMRDALRVYCPAPDKAARVLIRTRTFETSDIFASFQAALIWPDKEERDFLGVRRGFMIEFRDLVAL